MEILGWAVLRESYVFDWDYIDERLPEIVEDIQAYIKAHYCDSDNNFRTQLMGMNGKDVLQIALQNNHLGNWECGEALALFQYVAEVAPGSYGVLHIYDSDGQYGDGNEMYMVVMARGKLLRHRNPFLSPVLPKVEDPSPEYVLSYGPDLPLGTIVRLKGGEKRLMIIGRRQQDTVAERVFDYSGVPYPEGNVGPKSTFLFDNDAIEELVYYGFADEEEEAWVEKIHAIAESAD